MLHRLERGKTLSEKAYEMLLEEIRGMAPGANKLLSEEDIADNFGISRATVREAIKYLMMEGVVTKVQGKGIYAHPSALHVENRVDVGSDFYAMLKNHHMDVNLDIDTYGVRAPTAQCRQYLGNEVGDVLAMRWIYSADGIKRIHGQFEFPVSLLKVEPAAGFWVSGLPEFGRKYLHAPVAYCQMFIKCGFSKEAAAVYGVPEDVPMQCWQETIIDIDDRLVGFCEFFMHPTEMQMSVVTNFRSG